jgi:hypothetical protein
MHHPPKTPTTFLTLAKVTMVMPRLPKMVKSRIPTFRKMKIRRKALLRAQLQSELQFRRLYSVPGKAKLFHNIIPPPVAYCFE